MAARHRTRRLAGCSDLANRKNRETPIGEPIGVSVRPRRMRHTTSYVSNPQIRALFAHARKLKAERIAAEQGLPPRIKVKTGSVRKMAKCAACGGRVWAVSDKAPWSHTHD